MKTIPSNLYPKLLDLINETYVDKMDSIESAQVDEDGTIEAIAIDEGEKFACRYQNGAIEIKALNPDEQAKTVGFAAGKARNCKAGISCGNSCISKAKTCRKKGTSGQAEKAKEITAAVHPKFANAAKKAKDAPKVGGGSVTNLADRKKKGTNPEISKDTKELIDSLKTSRSLMKDVKATKVSGGKTVGDLQKELKSKNKVVSIADRAKKKGK